MKKLRLWLAFAVFCVVAVPVAVFLGGWWLAGPYEGDNGLFGMLGTLYGDALRGHPGALGLLFSPVLIVAIWHTAWQARSFIAARQAATTVGSGAASPNQGQ